MYDLKNQTFLFSLNPLRKYDLKDKQCIAIKCEHDYGPIFGNMDLYLNKEFTKGVIYSNNNSSFVSFSVLDILGENKDKANFNVKDIEMLRVNY